MAKNFYKEDFVKENTYDKPSRYSFEDIDGNTYGKITVVGWAGVNTYNGWSKPRNVWWCKCSCGNTDYFLVDKSSLKKGLTKSCGCNYKNNGGVTAMSKEDAEKELDERYKLLEYKGRRKPCKIECSVCNDVVESDSFYSVIQQKLVCSCKSVQKDQYLKNFLSSLEYTLVRRVDIRKSIVEIQCNNCKIKTQKTIPNIKAKCPCVISTKGVPSSVYLLVDKNNKGVYKIGKANDPYLRCETINNSARRNGYNHNFYVHSVKWFSSEETAYHVESLYHSVFKTKTLYDWKGTSDSTHLEFDGACEVFILDKQDFEDFNEKYKDHVDFLRTEGIGFVINKPYNENINRIINKDGTVNIWFPNSKSMFQYLGVKDTHSSSGMVKKNLRDRNADNFKLWYKEYTKNLVFEVDGVYYNSVRDFYEQHLHFTTISYSMFEDRVSRRKSWDIWDALVTPRIRNTGNKFYDTDRTETTATDLYNKYKPLLAYQTFKNRLLKGECPYELSKVIPNNSVTKIFLVNNRYYSSQQLLDITKPIVRSVTYYSRLERDWCPLIAACVPNIIGRSNDGSDKSEFIEDKQKYENLKIKFWVV